MNTFLIADLHLSHEGSCKWLNEDGYPIRPFANAAEMDEAIIENWNSVVKPCDKTYVLGDVAMKRSALPLLARMSGKKVLVKGNHDIFKLGDYTPYFYDIRGSHKLDNFLLTHIPVHKDSLARWCGGNIHGHLHNNRVMKARWYRDEEDEWNVISDVIDPQYYCVSLEHINYTPIAFEDVKALMKKQQGETE